MRQDLFTEALDQYNCKYLLLTVTTHAAPNTWFVMLYSATRTQTEWKISRAFDGKGRAEFERLEFG
jgi:hypothetical protein